MSLRKRALALLIAASPVFAEDKVEEVNLDELEEDKPKPNAFGSVPSKLPADQLPSEGNTVVEEMKPEDLAGTTFIPEYDRRPWLLALPLLALLVVVWNVDWREARVRAELVARRARRAPKKKETA